MPASDGADQAGPYEVAVSVTGLWAAPDAARALDAALTDAQPRPRDWLVDQGPTQRRTLWGRLSSQLLLGERVFVHEVTGGWARVSAPAQPSSLDPDGYPGFVPAHHLRPAAVATGRRVVVHHPVTEVRTAAEGAGSLPDVSFATVLPLIEEGADQVTVRLPGGRTGWLPGPHVQEVRAQQDAPTGEELVAAARQFRGVGYLPGGLHGLSFDCSGLVHSVCRRLGLTVPRDARDQLTLGADVPIDEARLGDLVFFTDPDSGAVYHVGFWVGTFAGLPQMLHASQTDRGVVDAPLSERRRDHLSHLRRLRLLS